MDNNLNDLTMKPLAVITGASSGIGYELAKQCGQNDFELLITAEESGIEEAAASLRALGFGVTTLQVDLANFEGVETLYRKIQSLNKPVDILAINAGVGVGGDFTRETSLYSELNLINLNVVSAVHLTKRMLRDMVERGYGRLLFTSSIAATMPGPFEAVYAASKAFLQSFAEAIRNEIQESGVTVTVLMPGPTETNFFQRAGMMDTKVGVDKKDDPADVAEEAFDALMAGKDYVVTGSFKNKVMDTVAKFIPQRKAADMHRQMTEPGSASKSS